jgi:hypothetical protein
VGIGILSICSFLHTVRIRRGGKEVEVRKNVSCTASMSIQAE